MLVGDHAVRQLVLFEKDIGWMAFWKLNPEVLVYLRLMTSANCGEWESWFV
jgi:hypothetical protein